MLGVGEVVVAQEGPPQPYYVSWRRRCLLLAAPNIRPATSEGSAAVDLGKQELDAVESKLGRDGEEGGERRI